MEKHALKQWWFVQPEDDMKSFKSDIRPSALSFTQLYTTHPLHFHPSYSCIFQPGSPEDPETVILQKGLFKQSFIFQSGEKSCNQNTAQENSYRVCSSNVLKGHVWTGIGSLTHTVTSGKMFKCHLKLKLAEDC